MSKGCYHLGEMTAAMIRLYCPDCHRFAQFKRKKLLEQFSPDKPMQTMLRDLKPCEVGNSLSGTQCQLRYWDAMTPEARAESIAKGGLPESDTPQKDIVKACSVPTYSAQEDERRVICAITERSHPPTSATMVI